MFCHTGWKPADLYLVRTWTYHNRLVSKLFNNEQRMQMTFHTIEPQGCSVYCMESTNSKHGTWWNQLELISAQSYFACQVCMPQLQLWTRGTHDRYENLIHCSRNGRPRTSPSSSLSPTSKKLLRASHEVLQVSVACKQWKQKMGDISIHVATKSGVISKKKHGTMYSTFNDMKVIAHGSKLLWGHCFALRTSWSSVH